MAYNSNEFDTNRIRTHYNIIDKSYIGSIDVKNGKPRLHGIMIFNLSTGDAKSVCRVRCALSASYIKLRYESIDLRRRIGSCRRPIMYRNERYDGRHDYRNSCLYLLDSYYMFTFVI